MGSPSPGLRPPSPGGRGPLPLAACPARHILLCPSGITLRDRWNRDDAVSRARCSPSAVKHDAEKCLLVAAAKERAVQTLRAWNAADELAVRCEDIHRLA